ncbi:MAG TPA: DUF4274 domain-containing protein, partial [Bacteroidetes bacterium]|nr:DUF4274 domain-containing protein [Bacteroidota bacterium]
MEENIKPLVSPTVKLYKKARKHNWDQGYNKLYNILRDKNCDKGTALMMYWLSSPQFFTQYADASKVPEWAIDNYDFVKYVEEKFLIIRNEEIIYDPVADGRLSAEKYAVKSPIP